MRISLLLIFILFVIAAYVGNNVYKLDMEENTTRDLLNWTENVFVWNSSNFQPVNLSKLNESNSTFINAGRVSNIINKVVDCAGYVLFEFGKWGLEFGYKNPKYDYEYVIDWMPTIIVLVVLAPFLPWMTVAFVFLVVVLGYYLYKIGWHFYQKHYIKQTGGEKNGRKR